MASSRHISTVPARQGTAASPDVPTFIDVFFEAQRKQLEALTSWQESLATCGKDCWEQWAVRYAGGMPFDG
jgi:hypothetical protein